MNSTHSDVFDLLRAKVDLACKWRSSSQTATAERVRLDVQSIGLSERQDYSEEVWHILVAVFKGQTHAFEYESSFRAMPALAQRVEPRGGLLNRPVLI